MNYRKYGVLLVTVTLFTLSSVLVFSSEHGDARARLSSGPLVAVTSGMFSFSFETIGDIEVNSVGINLGLLTGFGGAEWLGYGLSDLSYIGQVSRTDDGDTISSQGLLQATVNAGVMYRAQGFPVRLGFDVMLVQYNGYYGLNVPDPDTFTIADYPTLGAMLFFEVPVAENSLIFNRPGALLIGNRLEYGVHGAAEVTRFDHSLFVGITL
jgi:hypothetical protein